MGTSPSYRVRSQKGTETEVSLIEKIKDLQQLLEEQHIKVEFNL